MAGPTYLELFAGIGGFGLAIERVWPTARCVGYVERDAYAASVLLARMADQALEPAPVWVGDIRDLGERSLPPRVDILTGGFPCQDLSLAGARAGLGGERSGLWSEVVRIARIVQPRLVVLENVAAIRSARTEHVDETTGEPVRALGVVLSDLAALGYDAVWTCIRATEVGAPHQRDRWFCVGYAASAGLQGSPWRRRQSVEPLPGRVDLAHRDGGGRMLERRSGVLNGERAAQRDDAHGRHEDVAHARREPAERRRVAELVGRTPGEAVQDGEERERRGAHADGGVGALPLWPPGPADHEAWSRVLEHHPHLAPAIESGVRGVADGVSRVVDLHRTDRLRCLGNAIVPAQAAAAIRWCLEQIMTAHALGGEGERCRRTE